MSGDPYWYFVPYDDPHRALASLREREFGAGRYYPAMDDIRFGDPGFLALGTGPRHSSIEAARKDAGATGTRTIVDVRGISAEQCPGMACAAHPEDLEEWFGSEKPTHEMIEREAPRMFSSLARGECVYVVAYDGDKPSELFFAGYSWD